MKTDSFRSTTILLCSRVFFARFVRLRCKLERLRTGGLANSLVAHTLALTGVRANQERPRIPSKHRICC